MNLSPLDFIFIVLIAFFALSAFIRGFINEVFGKISVFLALGAAVLFSPKFEPYVHQSIQNEILSKVISFLLIFILADFVKPCYDYFPIPINPGKKGTKKRFVPQFLNFSGFSCIFAIWI